MRKVLWVWKNKKKMNEKNSIIVQRRSLRVSKTIEKGQILKHDDIIALRPCPNNGIPPYAIHKVIGKKLKKKILKGEHLTWNIIN